jgi:hypothetical protein
VHGRSAGLSVAGVRARRNRARDLTRVQLDVRLSSAADHGCLLALLDELPDAREVRVE